MTQIILNILNNPFLLTMMILFLINTVLFIFVFISLFFFKSKVKKMVIYILFIVLSLFSILDLKFNLGFINYITNLFVGFKTY
jgi:hypothetical protein